MRPACRAWLLVLLSAVACAGCLREGAKDIAQSRHVRSVSLEARKLLSGGDQQGWINSSGDAAGTDYCRAKIKLPLSAKPEWVYSYTPASFSGHSPSQILHRGGLLIVGASSSQLLGLDVANGKARFNLDVIKREKELTSAEILMGLALHPAGLIFGLDDLGRYYCWDADERTPVLVWSSAPTGEDTPGGYVAMGGMLLTSWLYRIRGVNATTGSQVWDYPMLMPSGKCVLSTDGVLIWWSYYGEICALETAAGKLLWRETAGTQIMRISIDDTRQRALISRYDEKLECRDLRSGELIWEHSWSDLLSEPERKKLGETSGFFRMAPREKVRILCYNFTVAPDAIYLALISGDVIKLGMDGKRIWRHHAEAPVSSVLGFENGVLASEIYFAPQALMPDYSYLPFMSKAPDWKSVRTADSDHQQRGGFQACAVLDPGTGARLSLVELEHPADTGPVPAYDKIVFGDSGEGGKPRVCAYQWLEAEEQ